jgi:NADH dehydrogenase
MSLDVTGNGVAQEGARLARMDGTTRPRVVIVGGGFGGLSAAHTLGKKGVDVLLIDRNNYHGFWPFLYQVASAQLETEEIAYPIRAVLRRYKNVEFQMADVRGVDFANRRVLTDGDPVPYDYLILAAGSETNYFGNDEMQKHAYGLKTVEEADRLRNHILAVIEAAAREKDPERRAALLTFVIVGAGPTGCELSGALATLIQRPLTKDFPTLDLKQARVLLVQGAPTVLPPFHEKLRTYAHQRLEKLGVEIKLGQVVEKVDNGVVHFSDGSQLGATTVVWAAGVRAADLVGTLGVETASLGRVKVTPTLNLADRPEVFAIGDVMHLDGYDGANGGPYPMLAQVAIQGGKQAAKNVLALAGGAQPKPFKYFDKGTMAIIGNRAAIVEAFGTRMHGTIAWFSWLFLHILYLIGFRNRILVLIDWGSAFMRSNQGVRIITRPEFVEHVAEVHEKVLDHRRRTSTAITVLSEEVLAEAKRE